MFCKKFESKTEIRFKKVRRESYKFYLKDGKTIEISGDNVSGTIEDGKYYVVNNLITDFRDNNDTEILIESKYIPLSEIDRVVFSKRESIIKL